MAVCPKDGKACCDDLCYGGGCMQMPGASMLETCDVCGGTIDPDVPECSTCTCDGDDEYGDYDEAEDERRAQFDTEMRRDAFGDA